jgi:hypothetical protein
MISRFLLSAALAIALVSGVSAHAEEAIIYGGTTPLLASSYQGAFMPAKTGLHCYSINENKCWDGNAWHEIYPLGPRHYAKPPPPPDLVSCAVIMKASHDCWDGAHWYRLPLGPLWGGIAPLGAVEDVNAFRTAPLR